jgi:protein TonB
VLTYGAPAPTRRATVLLSILLIHALVIIALVQWGPGEVPQIVPPRISLLKLMLQPKPLPMPPALSATLSAPPAPFIPPPEIHVVQPELRIQSSPRPVPTVIDGASKAPASGHGVPGGIALPSSPPVFVANDRPAYPARLRNSNAQGYVSVACEVQTDGTAKSCQVILLDGRPEFAKSVLDWLQNGTPRYRPALVNGALAIKTAAVKFYFVPNESGRN